MENALHVPLPEKICTHCAEHSRIESPDGSHHVAWCPHVKWGGIYYAETGLWQTQGPFKTEDQWVQRLITLNIVTPAAQL